MLSSGKDYGVFVFKPYPDLPPYTDHTINLSICNDTFISKSDKYIFNNHIKTMPKIEIRPNANEMKVGFICETSERENSIGFQFLLKN